mgnify:CR=1 FL=1
MRKVRVRFAPSPTGPLHVGGVRTALFNWLFARKHGGAFVLRIEDTDLERSDPRWERSLLEDLQWLGLDWDEGPDRGGPFGPYRQSERLALYREQAEKLLAEGWAYRCFCTEEELALRRRENLAAGRPPRYDGRCLTSPEDEVLRLLKARKSYALRFRVRPGRVVVHDLVKGEVAFEAEEFGDFVILKSDGWPAYNFAAVVDDHLMQVSHVIRGEDHLSNTPRQLLLYEALGMKPPEFAHLPLILGPDRSRLSKRHGAEAVAELREAGYLPEAVFNYLAFLGWSPEDGEEVLSREALIEQFDLARVGKAAAIFDKKKLDWLNGQHMRRANLQRLVELAVPYLWKAGIFSESYEPGYLARVIEAVRDGLSTLSELPKEAEVFFRFDPEAAMSLVSGLQSPVSSLQILEALREELLKRRVLTSQDYPELVKALERRTSLKGRALLRPIRAALTGKTTGPELQVLIPILGKEECLRRLDLLESAISSQQSARYNPH